MSGSFLDLEGFQWAVVDKLDPGPQASEPHRSFRRVGHDQKPVLGQLEEQFAGTSVAVGFPLNHLQGKNFRGTGFNMIFRPKPSPPLPGPGPNSGSQGRPDIGDVDTRPFVIGEPAQRRFFQSMRADTPNKLRSPPDLGHFVKKGTITEDIILNPNLVLRKAIVGLDIKETITFEVSTGPPTDQLTSGGVINIAFLMGAKNPEVKTEVKAATKTVVTETPTTGNPKVNAEASFMSSKFWIEFVDYKVDIPKLAANEKRVVQAKVPASAPVPTFQVTAPAGGFLDKKDFIIPGVQLQYSQMVHLDFGVKGSVLTWPHVSVATLVPTEPVDITLK